MMFQIMFYVGLSFAIVSCIISIVFFVKDGVAVLLKDLIGSNKNIKKKTILKNEKMQNEKNLVSRIEKSVEDDHTTILMEEETELLTEEETELLAQNQTECLHSTTKLEMPFGEETEVLVNEEEETEVLVPNSERLWGFKKKAERYEGEEIPLPDIFEVEEETMITHTKEKID